MRTKLILEMGCNHQGDLKFAKEMILDAYKLGAWAVKFQKRDLEKMTEEEKDKLRDPAVSLGETEYEHRKRLEFDMPQLAELKEFAHRKGMKFICTAFDEKSYVDLYRLKCDLIKFPSQLYSANNMQQLFNEYPAKLILSTGMHNRDEIFNQLAMWIGAEIIMHCVSIYPADISQFEMYTLLKLREQDLFKVGYSSHGINGKDVFYAVLCGAKVIERHYTLSKTMCGNDHETVSSDFNEILNIKKDIEYAEKILGSGKKVLCEAEQKMKDRYVK